MAPPPGGDDRSPGTATGTGPGDGELVAALMAGDDDAFARIVDAWSPSMLRLARYYVNSDSVAEDVVQEAWLGVLRGLDRFEGRSRLRTWALRIVANIAKTAAQKERRAVPFATGGTEGPGGSGDLPGPGPSVPPSRFWPAGEPRAGAWRTPPHPWPSLPEDEVLSTEAVEVVRQAVAVLPEGQRAVIELRDLDGYDAAEVCDVLGLTPVNQRVLLHRARATVRATVEPYFAEGVVSGERRP